MKLAYGNENKRVLKSVAKWTWIKNRRTGEQPLEKTYVYGLSSRPLAEISSDGTVISYVYGPTGLDGTKQMVTRCDLQIPITTDFFDNSTPSEWGTFAKSVGGGWKTYKLVGPKKA